jgi:hypothetical protein
MLVSLGEALEDARGDADRLRDALGAHSTAGKVLDTARTGRTWPGHRSLIDMGHDALEAPRGGRGPIPPCFFNPVHRDGPAAGGGRRAASHRTRLPHVRPLAVRARATPDVLRDGKTPYYEVDPERSVWATTGYGQFRGTRAASAARRSPSLLIGTNETSFSSEVVKQR